MKTNIFNKNGFLSAYGLACGYIQKHETKTHETQLYIEHSIYHVRQVVISKYSRSVDFWQCFETLSEAKKQYKKLIKNPL